MIQQVRGAGERTEQEFRLEGKKEQREMASLVKTDVTVKEAVVYEKSEQTEKSKAPYSVHKMSKSDRAALVEQMRKDTETRKAQFIALVTKNVQGQGKAWSLSAPEEENVFRFLAKGDFTVDEATKKMAKEEISENGYWGVKQTSERLFSFAGALAGDDPEKMKEMKEAMLKGFKEATKVWGKDLPDLSKETLKAAEALFEDYFSKRAEGSAS